MSRRPVPYGILAATVLLLLVSLAVPSPLPATTPLPPAAPSSPPPSSVPAPSATPAASPLAPVAATLWNQLCASGTGTGSCPPYYQPPKTYGSTGFWDPDDNLSFYFGGSTSTTTVTNELWYWNGTGWNESYTSPAPPARSNASGTWDVGDDYGLLFGGWNATTSSCYGDTWSYAPGIPGVGGVVYWTNLTATAGTAPAPRCGATMRYIPPTTSFPNGFVLLFGGKNGARYYNDTWYFYGGAWHNETAAIGNPAPSPRTDPGSAYDTVHDLFVLFGGLGPSGALNDTWKFTPSTHKWTEFYANGSTSRYAGPKPEFSMMMDYSVSAGVVFLTGGATGDQSTPTSPVALPYRSTWYFYNGEWFNDTTVLSINSVRAGTTQPSTSYGSTFIYDPLTGYVLLQGGMFSSAQNGTYQLGVLITVDINLSNGESAVGNSFHAWANVTGVGNIPPPTYTWSGLPSGCSPGNVSTFACSPSSAGTYTLSVNVTDSAGGSAIATASILIDPSATQAATASFSTSRAGSPPSTFWAFDYRCLPENNASCVAWLQDTPVRTLRVPGGMEGYNATSGVEYQHFGGTTSVSWSWPDIVSLCEQLRPCNIVPTLPAVSNDTSMTAADVAYVEANYSFVPFMWSPGNEPQGWVNLGQPLSPTPLPTPYDRVTSRNAYQVGIIEARADLAIQAYDTGAAVFAIQSATCANNTFTLESAYYAVQDHVANDPVVGCHTFPGGTGGVPSRILSAENVTLQATQIAALRAGLAAQGTPLPVWATEFSLNTGVQPSADQTNWVSVAMWGADAVQLLQMNVSQFEGFYLGCGGFGGILTLSCGPTNLSRLYTNVFDHLRTGSIYNASFATSMNGLYGLEGTNSTGTSYLFVNTNTSVAADLSLPASVRTGPATVYAGAPSTNWSGTMYGTSDVPLAYTLPPEGVLLVDVAGPGGSPGSPLLVPSVTVSPMPTSATLDWGYNSVPVDWASVSFGSSCSDLNERQVVYGNVTSVTVNGLRPLTSYCFVVTLQTVAGPTLPSASVTVTTPLLAFPKLPVSVHAPVVTTTEVAFILAGIVLVAAGGAIHRHRRRFSGSLLLLIGAVLVVAGLLGVFFT